MMLHVPHGRPSMMISVSVVLALLLASSWPDETIAFSPVAFKRTVTKTNPFPQPASAPLWRLPFLRSSVDDFSNFAASLESDNDSSSSTSSKTPSQSSRRAPRTATVRNGKTSTVQKPAAAAPSKTWQDDLEELLSLDTTAARRQILLQQLLNANQEIRKSVEKALQERNIDPLLTPTGKRLQDGTRAVARQLSTDILPRVLAASYSAATSSNDGSSRRRRPFPLLLLPPVPRPPSPTAASDLTKVGTRILNALQNQIQQNLETFTSDLLADPSRIPQRLSQQTTELVKEATNVFSETPVGLQEPPYTVVTVTDDYEIRDYDAHYCAVTKMRVPANSDDVAVGGSTSSEDSVSYYFDSDNVAEAGAAFNSLAAYLFGANKESRVMSMTTPVTTTLTGEMRFYLADKDTNNNKFPDPLEQDESRSVYETGSIAVEEIPAARLAVRRFTGFCTTGEISRQKQTLLTALALDGVALDVPHGQTVGHVVFQYNPPYTIPVLRRNEIAVPVVSEPRRQQEEWQAAVGGGDEYDAEDDNAWESAPSD